MSAAPRLDLPLSGPPERPSGTARLIPHIAVHCFAENEAMKRCFQSVSGDKRMRRTSLDVVEGGLDAAITRYRTAPSPNLIVVEAATGEDTQMIWRLDQLADVCDAGTQVVVVGHTNDIGLYRKLTDYGVSDYFVAPVDPGSLVDTVERLFCDSDAPKLGSLYAFIGAKGGVGSSTVAQNTAWTLAERRQSDVLLADMDLDFGTAALGCNVEQGRGMAEALREIDRLDDALLERLMIARGKRLRLLCAPDSLDTRVGLSETAVDTVLDTVQRAMPFVALDLPHAWSDWVKLVLRRADGVVVTATPTLPGMRNAVSLIDSITRLRPTAPPPLLALNQIGTPRRAEISLKEIQTTMEIAPTACIGFNAHLFGVAESRGLMLSELSGGAKTARAFESVADALTGHTANTRPSVLRRLLGR